VHKKVAAAKQSTLDCSWQWIKWDTRAFFDFIPPTKAGRSRWIWRQSLPLTQGGYGQFLRRNTTFPDFTITFLRWHRGNHRSILNSLRIAGLVEKVVDEKNDVGHKQVTSCSLRGWSGSGDGKLAFHTRSVFHVCLKVGEDEWVLCEFLPNGGKTSLGHWSARTYCSSSLSSSEEREQDSALGSYRFFTVRPRWNWGWISPNLMQLICVMCHPLLLIMLNAVGAL
jgi:hypothetical protein